MLLTVLTYAAAVLSGVVLALKVIAPMTKNTVDDKVLTYVEKAEDVVTELKGAVK